MLKGYKKIVVFFIIVILGSVIGVLGSSTFLNLRAIAPFWPASAIQALSGLLFGFTGAFAGAFFPIISNIASGIPTNLVVLLVLPNLIQSFLPLIVMHVIKFTPYKFNYKTIVSFIFLCVVLPNVLSAWWVSNINFFTVTNPVANPRLMVFLLWLKSNIPSGIIFGLLLLKTLAPALKNCEFYSEQVESDDVEA